MKILITLLLALFISGCGSSLDILHTEAERAEYNKRHDELIRRERIELREKRFGHKETVNLCMDWDDAWNDRYEREKIIEELKARGQDPMLCRSTSNSSDEAKRATAIAIQAARRARAAEDRAYDAEREASDNRRRQNNDRSQQQSNNNNEPMYQSGGTTYSDTPCVAACN